MKKFFECFSGLFFVGSLFFLQACDGQVKLPARISCGEKEFPGVWESGKFHANFEKGLVVFNIPGSQTTMIAGENVATEVKSISEKIIHTKIKINHSRGAVQTYENVDVRVVAESQVAPDRIKGKLYVYGRTSDLLCLTQNE